MRFFWLKPLSPFQFNVTISLNMSAGPQDLIPWEFRIIKHGVVRIYVLELHILLQPAKTAISPFSSLLGMFLLRNVPSGEEKPLVSQANLRVRSNRKSGFRFKNPDFGFAIEREIRKQISMLRYLFFRFSSLPFDWEIRKRI